MTTTDAYIKVCCNGERCREEIEVALPFVYRDQYGNGGHYDHDKRYINRQILDDGWTVVDDRHYCESCAGHLPPA